uniref:G-protein coupled receptors family 1 profile domain-containing protein n=1 Tax=Leptobrachium leishanense TaxID=445787 RepID=A0A8C5M4T2_9ANUR
MDGFLALFGNEIWSTSRGNSSQVTEFLLICFPDVRGWYWSFILMWCLVMTLVCNTVLLIVICVEPRLHHPMYYFLAILTFIDILQCTVATPKILSILISDMKTITATACFSQMFFIHLWSSMESSTFLVMAYDRYVAICYPLHYVSVVTDKLVLKAFMFILGRNVALILPLPFMSANLNYCSSRQILHCFCENMSVEKLACGKNTPGTIYSLVIFIVVGGSDLLFIGLSYAAILRSVVRARSYKVAFKAFRICSSHLILICFFYATIGTAVASSQTLRGIPRHMYVLLALLQQLVTPLFNPIIYGVMTREIRDATRRILTKAKVHPGRR